MSFRKVKIRIDSRMSPMGNKLEDFWRGILGGGPRHTTNPRAERKSPSALTGDYWGVKYGRVNKGGSHSIMLNIMLQRSKASAAL